MDQSQNNFNHCNAQRSPTKSPSFQTQRFLGLLDLSSGRKTTGYSAIKDKMNILLSKASPEQKSSPRAAKRFGNFGVKSVIAKVENNEKKTRNKTIPFPNSLTQCAPEILEKNSLKQTAITPRAQLPDKKKNFRELNYNSKAKSLNDQNSKEGKFKLASKVEEATEAKNWTNTTKTDFKPINSARPKTTNELQQPNDNTSLVLKELSMPSNIRDSSEVSHKKLKTNSFHSSTEKFMEKLESNNRRNKLFSKSNASKKLYGEKHHHPTQEFFDDAGDKAKLTSFSRDNLIKSVEKDVGVRDTNNKYEKVTETVETAKRIPNDFQENLSESLSVNEMNLKTVKTENLKVVKELNDQKSEELHADLVSVPTESISETTEQHNNSKNIKGETTASSKLQVLEESNFFFTNSKLLKAKSKSNELLPSSKLENTLAPTPSSLTFSETGKSRAETYQTMETSGKRFCKSFEKEKSEHEACSQNVNREVKIEQNVNDSKILKPPAIIDTDNIKADYDKDDTKSDLPELKTQNRKSKHGQTTKNKNDTSFNGEIIDLGNNCDLKNTTKMSEPAESCPQICETLVEESRTKSGSKKELIVNKNMLSPNYLAIRHEQDETSNFSPIKSGTLLLTNDNKTQNLVFNNFNKTSHIPLSKIQATLNSEEEKTDKIADPNTNGVKKVSSIFFNDAHSTLNRTSNVSIKKKDVKTNKEAAFMGNLKGKAIDYIESLKRMGCGKVDESLIHRSKPKFRCNPKIERSPTIEKRKLWKSPSKIDKENKLKDDRTKSETDDYSSEDSDFDKELPVMVDRSVQTSLEDFTVIQKPKSFLEELYSSFIADAVS